MNKKEFSFSREEINKLKRFFPFIKSIRKKGKYYYIETKLKKAHYRTGYGPERRILKVRLGEVYWNADWGEATYSSVWYKNQYRKPCAGNMWGTMQRVIDNNDYFLFVVLLLQFFKDIPYIFVYFSFFELSARALEAIRKGKYFE